MKLSSCSVSTDDDGGHPCHVCGATYKHRYSLGKHMKSHDGQTCCSICGRQLSMMSALRRHMMFKHNLARQEVDRMTDNKLGRYAMQEMAQRAAGVAGEEIVPPGVAPSERAHYTGYQ